MLLARSRRGALLKGSSTTVRGNTRRGRSVFGNLETTTDLLDLSLHIHQPPSNSKSSTARLRLTASELARQATAVARAREVLHRRRDPALHNRQGSLAIHQAAIGTDPPPARTTIDDRPSTRWATESCPVPNGRSRVRSGTADDVRGLAKRWS